MRRCAWPVFRFRRVDWRLDPSRFFPLAFLFSGAVAGQLGRRRPEAVARIEDGQQSRQSGEADAGARRKEGSCGPLRLTGSRVRIGGAATFRSHHFSRS